MIEAAKKSSARREVVVADEEKLLQIGMAAVFTASLLFAIQRFAAQVAEGKATPWWADAGGAIAVAVLYLWYRGDRTRRMPFAIHASAVIADVILVIPAAYGMTSSKWWLALVGFAVLLMGRRAEAIAWSIVTVVLLPLVALLEERFVVTNAIGESQGERAMSAMVFVVVLFGITWAYRRVAQQRARELTETAASLERANLVKSRFLAHMSHEIRTPLHGVIAMTDMALQEDASKPVREQLQTAQQSARGLLGLLNNVLDVTRAESDALVLESRPFSLHATLTDLLRPLAAQARAKGLELVARADAGVVEQRVGDGVRFGQIVVNLVSNALKFTEKGRIDVTLGEAAPGRVTLKVTDTGIGVPKDKTELIFEPFAQAEDADHRVEGGVGLGLAIVREVARRMNGAVTVTSEPGKGSTFEVEVELPCGEPQKPGPRELLAATEVPEPAKAPPSRRALDVLVCEDNLVNQKVMLAMLARLGHRATVANDGLAAWELLRTRAFDLVLTDIEMPGLDGVALTQRIRAREATEAGASRVPVVGATAHVGEAERHRLVDAGMDDYLGKPFTLAELSSAIHRVKPTAA